MVLNAGSNHLSTEPLIARPRTLASPLSPLAPSAAVDNLEQSILAPLGLLQRLLQLPDLLLSLRSRLLGPAATTTLSPKSDREKIHKSGNNYLAV